MAAIAITLAVPDTTGASKMVKNYADALLAAGHSIKLVHGTPAKDHAGNPSSILDEFEPGEIEREYIPGLRRPIPPGIYKSTRAAASGCDAIIGFNQRDRAVALKVASMLKVPGILSVQNQHRFRGPSMLAAVKRKYYGRIVRNLGTAFVCTSERVRDELLQLRVPPHRCAVLPNAIELPDRTPADDTARNRLRQELGLKPDDIVFTNVGRLDAQKGQDVLLRAWAAAGAGNGHARLLLVGDVNNANQLNASRLFKSALIDYAAAHQLENSVMMTGWRDDVEQILEISDGYLHSARWEGPPAPLAVLEAMAASLPIVFTDCSGKLHGFEEGVHGFTARAGDDRTLTDAIKQIIDKPAHELQQMGAKCRELSEEKFDLQKIGKQFVRIVEAAIDNPDQDFSRFTL